MDIQILEDRAIVGELLKLGRTQTSDRRLARLLAIFCQFNSLLQIKASLPWAQIFPVNLAREFP
jgi:hypothetical protein